MHNTAGFLFRRTLWNVKPRQHFECVVGCCRQLLYSRKYKVQNESKELVGRAAAQSGWWAERWSKDRKYEGCGRPLHIAAVPLSWPLAGGEEISKNTSTASTKSQRCKTMTLYRQRPRIGMLWSPITITGSGTCQLRYWSADSSDQEVLLMRDNGLFVTCFCYKYRFSYWFRQFVIENHIFSILFVILLLMSVIFICVHWVFKYTLTLKWGWEWYKVYVTDCFYFFNWGSKATKNLQYII